MQMFLILVAASHLSLVLTWNPQSGDERLPELGRPANSNTPQLRRRPPPAAYSLEDVELLVSPTWPDPNLKFGQISAVSVDQHGQVFIFHRGPHTWDSMSFDIYDNYLPKDKGPIFEDTVIVVNPITGAVLKTWGKGLFYLPHGLTVDHEDNLWLTDVALHQVFKFPPLVQMDGNTSTPLLALGKRFENGKDDLHFCKPSAVAVLKNGDFFVSDGYCNSRIIKFNKEGLRVMTWGRSTFSGSYGRKPAPYQFQIPHALTIAEDRGLVCAADRENGRVQCFYSNNGTFVYEIASEEFGSRVFSVAYTPSKGGLYYIVNGPDGGQRDVQGFIVDANTLNVVSKFRPGNSQLSNPHDVAVSPDGEVVFVVQLDPHRAWKFVHKGGKTSEVLPSTSVNVNPATSPVASIPSTPASSSNPSVNSMEAGNSTSSLPVGLNLMANSSFAKAMTTPLVAISSLMVVLMCVVGSGIIWCIRSRHRAYPAIPNEGFNLGHLLASHSRRGFEQVSTEESDDDRAESDQPA